MTLPKFLTKWWVWLGAIAVIGGGFFFLTSGEEQAEYLTEMVERKDLLQTVDANGEVVSIDEVELSFDLSGTVQNIAVAVGDRVGVGDVLMALDSSELLANVRSAWQAVQVAQGTLDAQRAGVADETVAVSARALDVVKASLHASEVDYQNKLDLLLTVEDQYDAEVRASFAALKSANADLELVISDNEADVEDAYDDLLSAAWAVIIEVRAGIAKADEILGEENGTLNDDYERFIGAVNSEAEGLARTAYGAASDARDSAEALLLSASYGDEERIEQAAEQVSEATNEAMELLLYTREAIEGIPVTGDLTATEFNTLLTGLDSARSALQLDQASLRNAFQSVSSVLRSASSSLSRASLDVDQAQANYDAAVAARSYQLAVAENAVDTAEALLLQRQAEVEQAQASLEEVAADPRLVDLVSYEAEVSRATAAYDAAQARLAKAQIVSPIVGDVTDITVEVGEQVALGAPVITVQTTTEQFEILAEVSESDIAKLEVGDPAQISFDAFGSEVEVEGVVRDINPAELLIEGVVYYEITVQFTTDDEAFLSSLRPGLSADLIITTDQRENTISIPQRAIVEEEGEDHVRVLSNGEIELRLVETGIRGDLGRVEILSGLEAGEEIVIRELSQ